MVFKQEYLCQVIEVFNKNVISFFEMNVNSSKFVLNLVILDFGSYCKMWMDLTACKLKFFVLQKMGLTAWL